MNATPENQPNLRWRWERAARERMPKGVNITAQAVAWQLVSYGDEHGESIRPSLRRIAQAMAVADKTVSRGRSVLVRAKMIEVVRKARPGLTPTYRLCDPTMWRDLAPSTSSHVATVTPPAGAPDDVNEPPTQRVGVVLHGGKPCIDEIAARGELVDTPPPRPRRPFGTRPSVSLNPDLAARMRAERADEAVARSAALNATELANDPLLAEMLAC